MNHNGSRNPFVALCEYASQGNWCWTIHCTTCGHSAFRFAFSKIIHGQHPDNESFWPKSGSREHSEFYTENSGKCRDFSGPAHVATQEKLATIVAEAKISDIQAVAKFPDWLGYIGLVLTHCPSSNARKILSAAFLPQFIELVSKDAPTYQYLQEKFSKNEVLNIDDLGRIESSLLRG